MYVYLFMVLLKATLVRNMFFKTPLYVNSKLNSIILFLPQISHYFEQKPNIVITILKYRIRKGYLFRGFKNNACHCDVCHVVRFKLHEIKNTKLNRKETLWVTADPACSIGGLNCHEINKSSQESGI